MPFVYLVSILYPNASLPKSAKWGVERGEIVSVSGMAVGGRGKGIEEGG